MIIFDPINTTTSTTTIGSLSTTIFVKPRVISSSLTQSICVGDSPNFSLTSTISGTKFDVTRSVTNTVSMTCNNISDALAFINSVRSDIGTITYTIQPFTEPTWNGATVRIDGDPVTLTVTVNDLPATPIISPSGPTTFCQGGAVTLTASVTGTSYVWKKNNGDIAGSSASSTIIASERGTYTVAVVNENGCTSTASNAIRVTVNRLPTSIIQHDGPVLRVSSIADHYQWYLDGHKIDGATSASYVPTRAGTYKVMTTNRHGCTVTSESHRAMAVDIPTRDGDFTIFPNPNDGHFQIEKPSDVEIEELQIIRVHDGNTMYRKKTRETKVNLPGLPSGYYIIIIKTEPKSGHAPFRAIKFIVRK